MAFSTRQGPNQTRVRLAAGVLAAAGVVALPVAAAAAPSPSAEPVAQAGTSFRTAVPISPGQQIQVDATTSDFLYWSFSAESGQVIDISSTIELPPAEQRSGPATWTVEVFDGLRRRQACTSGAQMPVASATDKEVALGCTLRRVRSWAEPWSGDPLPGTYYVRLSAVDLPESDLGLATRISARIDAHDGGSSADDGDLKAALVPPAGPGKVVAEAASSPEEDDSMWSWLPGLSARWIWTTIGGILAAGSGVFGFSLTWRRRR